MSPITLHVIIVHLAVATGAYIPLETIAIFHGFAIGAKASSAVGAVQDVAVAILGTFHTVGQAAFIGALAWDDWDAVPAEDSFAIFTIEVGGGAGFTG